MLQLRLLFIEKFLPLSLAGSAVALLLLMLEPLLRKKTGSRWLYLSWLVPVVFFLLPLRLPRFPLVTRAPAFQELAPVALADVVMRAPLAPAKPQAASAGYELVPYDLLALVWLAGILWFTANLLWSSLRFWRAIRCNRYAVEEPQVLALLDACKAEKQVTRKILLYRCPLISSPMLVGIFRPCILLPEVQISQADLRLVLLHELTHYKNKDLLIKLLALLVHTLHWFNPLVWLIQRRIDQLCELSCDASVIRGMQPDERRAYGMAILNVMGQARLCPPVSSAFNLPKESLKKRLSLIVEGGSQTRILLLVGTAALVILALAGGWIASYVRGNRDGILLKNPASASTAQQLAKELASSFELEVSTQTSSAPTGLFRFTIPAATPKEYRWYILLNGRVKAGEDGEMSAHWMQEHSEKKDWEPGQTYTESFEPGSILELHMECQLLDENGRVVGADGFHYEGPGALPESRPADPPSSLSERLLEQMKQSIRIYPGRFLQFTLPEVPEGYSWKVEVAGIEGKLPFRWGVAANDPPVENQAWLPDIYLYEFPKGSDIKQLAVDCELESETESTVGFYIAWDEGGVQRVGQPGRIQLMLPTEGQISASFSPSHTGVDFAAAQGSAILAAESGVVSKAVTGDAQQGNYLVLDHGNGVQTLYAACSELLVKQGAVVRQGDEIARVGATGHATGPHLHFELLLDGISADPSVLEPPERSFDPWHGNDLPAPETVDASNTARKEQSSLVPDLVGLNSDEANALLVQAGLQGDTPAQEQLSDANLVVAQSVPAGTRVKQGTVISLQLEASDGALQFQWPAPAATDLGAGFDLENGRTGITLQGDNAAGSAIFPAAKGHVVQVKTGVTGAGNVIVVEHSNGYQTRYGHCDKLLVQEGDWVETSTQLATLGRSGNAPDYQLSFEVWQGEQALDPWALLHGEQS